MMGQGWMGCKKKVEYQLEKFMEKNRDNINMTLSLLIKIQTDPNRSKPTLQIENVNFEHFFNRLSDPFKTLWRYIFIANIGTLVNADQYDQ